MKMETDIYPLALELLSPSGADFLLNVCLERVCVPNWMLAFGSAVRPPSQRQMLSIAFTALAVGTFLPSALGQTATRPSRLELLDPGRYRRHWSGEPE